MDASARNELNAIKAELNSIIMELESLEAGIRKDFFCIGSEICADRLSDVLHEKLYKARRALNNLNTARVTEQYAKAHSSGTGTKN